MKPDPRIGMAVTWVDTETLMYSTDLQFMISKYGFGPFRINELKPITVDGVPCADWEATLTQNGTLLLGKPAIVGDSPAPRFIGWYWLQPLPQPKLQIGSLVTWASEDEIDDDVHGRDYVLRDLHKAFGQGPFVVAIQTGLVVTLVDKDSGIPLSGAGSQEPLEINRCFVSPI